jgi:signal transduction histidine kinase
LWARFLRLALLATLAALALSEGQQLIRALESTSGRRAELIDQTRLAFEHVRPFVESARERSGALEAARTLRNGVPLALAAEGEVLDRAGNVIASFPTRAPVTHRPSAAELQQIEAGAVVQVGPIAGDAARLLSYMRLPCCAEIARLATPAEDFVADLRVQRRNMGAQVVRLAVLLLAAILALLPKRENVVTGPDGSVLAYQEAMTRLKAGREQELERYERDLRRMEDSRRDLESMARAGELTAGVVHEVRNGLGAILGNARLLEAGAPGPAERALTTDIVRECESLATVVRRFVEFARRESLAVEPLDPRRLLERLLSRETTGIAASKVDVHWRHEGEGVIMADEALLERALENLLRNAREAAAPGGGVEVASVLSAAGWHLEITDTGPGFPPELLERGARPFLTHKPGGLGLGLALATKIVRLHGGTLSLRANAPVGAKVVVDLLRDGLNTG